MNPQYAIGIDLGTTNCVLAYCRLADADDKAAVADVNVLSIDQLVAPHTVEARKSLPSFTYLANDSELADGALALPWDSDQAKPDGHYARTRGAEAPMRTVGASKSWLCHHDVDRRADILPFNAPDEVARISPVQAAIGYLRHLVSAWHHTLPGIPLAEQSVVLTVPASFDPVARELTLEAAVASGLPENLVLLEEPQAALYAWLYQQGNDWRSQLKVGDRVLICDVGGGTTDLTLVDVDESDGELSLQRIAVGEHLLVGGDNMDLTAAHIVAQKFAEQGTDLDAWQNVSLWHSCRDAKEHLLSENRSTKDTARDSYTISVLGRGSKLIASTVSTEVNRDELAGVLLDGFFPACSLHDAPQRQVASGFQEIGLPFESDPGITRHIAAFVNRHGHQDDGQVRLPNYVLFNGGVLKAHGFQNRLLDVMSDWSEQAQSPHRTVSLDASGDLDFAVARGASFYAWSKRRGGLRIRGGVAHSYYIGIETAGLAIPGAPRPLKALCVVPFGMEEGTNANVPSGELGLVVGQSAQFRFFRSSFRHQDEPGVMLDASTEGLDEIDSLVATLTLDDADGSRVPVRFESRITELGMFELWCIATNGSGEWKLEFNVRED